MESGVTPPEGFPVPVPLPEPRPVPKAPAPQRRQPRTLELTEPVQFGQELITTLVLQPITGAQMRAVPLPKPGQVHMGYFLELASLASGHPDVVFDKLCPQDVLAVVNEVAAMVGPSVGTSAKV